MRARQTGSKKHNSGTITSFTLFVCGILLSAVLPAAAIPPAAAPTLLGLTVGGELGFAGKGVGGSHISYYGWAEGGVGRLLSVKGEILGGNGGPTLKTICAQFSVAPLPLVSIVAEPGVSFVGNSTGPSLGLRATGSLLSTLRITGYARIHYLDSTATTELGVGADIPIGSGLRGSLSAIQFNGGFEPNGVLFLAGLNYRLGL